MIPHVQNVDTDAEALAAVKAGDIERYAELVDKYQTTAIQLAYGLLGNREDAKDVSQEAFVKAYNALANFHGEARFSSWLYRIVVNKCKDKLRERQRTPVMVHPEQGDKGEEEKSNMFTLPDKKGQDPARQAEERELALEISLAVQSLPFKQRTAFVLHHMQGRTLQEVAGVMKCRLGTVKAHVFRATQQLQQKLSKWI